MYDNEYDSPPIKDASIKPLAVKELFEPLLAGLDLEESEVHQVWLYYNEQIGDMFYSTHFKGDFLNPIQLFPKQILGEKDYFLVEFWIKPGADKGYFNFKHAFQIDKELLKASFNKKENRKSSPDIYEVEQILGKVFTTMADLLGDFNGIGNEYDKMTLYLRRNRSSSLQKPRTSGYFLPVWLEYKSEKSLYNNATIKPSEVKKLYNPILKRLDSDECEVHLIQLYYTEVTDGLGYETLFCADIHAPLLLFPGQSKNQKDYFTIEYWIKTGKERGYFAFKHTFQLNITILKKAFEKIAPETSFPDGNGIAKILKEDYASITKHLKDFNGKKNNYTEIAKRILVKYST